jgi:hypothetical protein
MVYQRVAQYLWLKGEKRRAYYCLSYVTKDENAVRDVVD